MAKKAKATQEKDREKKPNALVRMWKRFTGWCHDMKVELKKVVWPKRKELVNACLVVAACILIVGVFIWILDGVAAEAIKALIDVSKGLG